MPYHFELVIPGDRFSMRILAPDQDGKMLISLEEEDPQYTAEIEVDANEFLQCLNMLVETSENK